MLPLRLLWRNWRSGEVRILAGALILAVAVVSCISMFTDRLDTALTAQSHTFLGADRVVRSSQPRPPEWQPLADKYQLGTATTIRFNSMVYSGDNMHLASVKAVSAAYPLLGELTISEQPFATDPEKISVAAGGPPAGQAWVDSRLLPLLDVSLGEEVVVGEKPLTITRVIIDEPDRGSNFSAFGARLMMNESDLAATRVIQPGSRVRYSWLLSGPENTLRSMLAELKPLLSPHERIVDVESAQQGLAKTLDTGRKFLMLSAMISVLLAGVAIAIAARRFAQRHVDQVALMKSLGAGCNKIRRLYAVQLLVLSLAASLIGLLLGSGLQALVAASVSSLFPVQLAAPGWTSLLPGLLTGIVCLVFFVAPPLWHLPTVPPIKILRRELAVSSVHYYWQAFLGLLAMIFLVVLFSRDWWLSGSIVLAIIALLVLVAAFATLLLGLGRQLGRRAGSVWRLALSGLQRNAQQSVVQMMVFGLAIMLLLSLTSLRTTLLEDWQLQLPSGTPNHFLMNIATDEVPQITAMMAQRDLEPQHMFPMVRGRLTHINGQEPTDEIRQRAEMLRREVNLSWTDTMSSDNKIVAGDWWDGWHERGVYGVSVEEQTAQDLGLELGDDLQFSLGGLRLEARVASIRSLKWDSMNPNFFFLLSPGALDDFSPTYLTSVYLPPEQKLFINQLLGAFPTVVVIEMDRVIAQIQAIVAQVSAGVELMLWLVVLGGFFVMWAAVSASMESRMQEAALLRALGSSRQRLLGSLWIEFSLLGFFSGVMAAVGAEILLLSIQYWVLDIPLRFHWQVWLLGIAGSALLIGLLGVISCRKVIHTPPGRMLREIA
ncbi:FtsX-like permease family protein [Aestuariicella hydrocarbonica]|uniref:FtsX-like permease family protein n=1 Tax=Pseudomaricurvus hydrocarbonicus TaxID=1470433 RepID=A0A9E5JQB5_9GAMM|nr:FtsX-like permease family protein [Aestuariicella hydrocarbonica]NHO64514.1 FtsX-like permease family protein [Aestuariicella hydrocarbonica]